MITLVVKVTLYLFLVTGAFVAGLLFVPFLQPVRATVVDFAAEHATWTAEPAWAAYRRYAQARRWFSSLGTERRETETTIAQLRDWMQTTDYARSPISTFNVAIENLGRRQSLRAADLPVLLQLLEYRYRFCPVEKLRCDDGTSQCPLSERRCGFEEKHTGRLQPVMVLGLVRALDGDDHGLAVIAHASQSTDLETRLAAYQVASKLGQGGANLLAAALQSPIAHELQERAAIARLLVRSGAEGQKLLDMMLAKADPATRDALQSALVVR